MPSLNAFLIAIVVSVPAMAASRLVYMYESNGIKQIYAKTGSEAPKAITQGASWHLYPDVDGSGRYVTYVEGDAQDQMRVVVMDLTTNVREIWTMKKGSYLHPDLSGDGKWLAFSGPGAKIGLINLEEARKTLKPAEEVTAGEKLLVYNIHPTWVDSTLPCYFPALSADGSFLIYQTSSNDKKQLHFYDPYEKKSTDVTDGSAQTMAPSLSFDDRWVVFTQKDGDNWNLHRWDRVSKKFSQITNAPSREFAPTFTADGSVIYASDASGTFGLYQIPADAVEKGGAIGKALVSEADADLYAPSVSGELSIVQGRLSDIPAPARSSFGTARVGNRIYIVGGHQGHEHTYPPESFLDRVDYYDLSTNQWHSAAPRPVKCHGYGVVAHGQYLYAFGGFAYSADHKPGWKSIDQVDRYDTQTNTWKTVGKLPRARSSNAVAKIGDKVYLIGGWDSTPKKHMDFEGRFHPEIDIFDLKSETSSVSPVALPNPLRRALTSVVIDESVLLIGGLGQGATHFELLDKVTKFTPVSGAIEELPPLPFATFAPAAEMLGQKLYVFGGMFKTGEMNYSYVNHIFELPLAGKRWLHTGRFVTESKGFSMVQPIDDKTLAILGGHAYFVDTDSPVATFETFRVN